MKYELITLEQTDFAQRVASTLGLPLHSAKKNIFADGELQVVLEVPARFQDATVLIIQATGSPVHDQMMSVAFLAHELKNAGAYAVHAVMPYVGYARQEKSPIAGKAGHMAVVARMLESAGIDELSVIELHDLYALHFFTIPVDNHTVTRLITHDIKQRIQTLPEICIVAPDEGARERAQIIAHELGVPSMVFSKERYATDKTRIVSHKAKAPGSIAIIVDDIIATGGTAIHVADVLHTQGFAHIWGYFVHPVFAGDAIEKVEHSHFDTIVVGNTLPLSPVARACTKVVQFDVSSVISDFLMQRYRVPLKNHHSRITESTV